MQDVCIGRDPLHSLASSASAPNWDDVFVTPCGQAGGDQSGMRVCNCRFAIVEKRSRQYRARMACANPRNEIRDRSHATTRNDRNVHRVGNRSRQFKVIAVPRAVMVHRRNQQLAGAHPREIQRVFDSVYPRGGPSAMRKDLPVVTHTARIDRPDDALASESLGDVCDKRWTCNGGGIDRDLVRPREEEGARIFSRSHATTDGQRHEADLGCAADDVDNRVAPFMRGPNVEEAQLVRSRSVISTRCFDRIAGIAQIYEVDALHHAAVLDVQTRNDANANRHALAATASAVARSSRPSYNARPVITPSIPSFA